MSAEECRENHNERIIWWAGGPGRSLNQVAIEFEYARKKLARSSNFEEIVLKDVGADHPSFHTEGELVHPR